MPMYTYCIRFRRLVTYQVQGWKSSDCGLPECKTTLSKCLALKQMNTLCCHPAINFYTTECILAWLFTPVWAVKGYPLQDCGREVWGGRPDPNYGSLLCHVVQNCPIHSCSLDDHAITRIRLFPDTPRLRSCRDCSSAVSNSCTQHRDADQTKHGTSYRYEHVALRRST